MVNMVLVIHAHLAMLSWVCLLPLLQPARHQALAPQLLARPRVAPQREGMQLAAPASVHIHVQTQHVYQQHAHCSACMSLESTRAGHQASFYHQI
jgi:hypothetical protein